MKFFLDTANIEQINKANAYGILDGITTNPSLIAKEGADHAERILEICQLVLRPNTSPPMNS
jgi:transaldolase